MDRLFQKDLGAFPDAVQHDIGFALMVAQFGGKHKDAKPWKGLGSGVMEIVNNYDTNTYRAIYTVTIGRAKSSMVNISHAVRKAVIPAKAGIQQCRVCGTIVTMPRPWRFAGFPLSRE